MQSDNYDPGLFYDELFAAPGQPRPEAKLLLQRIAALPDGDLLRKQRSIEQALLLTGITFGLHSEEYDQERVLPFDIIPRIVTPGEWAQIENGLRQRIQALNLFIDDIYQEQRILRDGVIPGDLVRSSGGYRPACVGLAPPQGIWCHIAGTDLVRDVDGQLYVLEDNLRTPSGVSYVLENRRLLKLSFPRMFDGIDVQPVDLYPAMLLDTLLSVAPAGVRRPKVVVLTPGPYNSAYFEHSFLAQQMGVDLVQGADLAASDGAVWARTTRGPQRVDVIYRRIDDDFLDPTTFRTDSLLGVPGLMRVYAEGRVALVNAPGAGIADDKAVYAYVPAIIKYYLGEEAIIPNVPTYVCAEPDQCEYVLENLGDLVVKTAGGSGGYGMLIGPQASADEIAEFRDRVRARPRDYIAQPMIRLSRAPTLVDDHLEGRHVDLRPFILYGRKLQILPGGLTRVALRRGSLVVNSSQGGGTKDTWVLRTLPEGAPQC